MLTEFNIGIWAGMLNLVQKAATMSGNVNANSILL